MVHHGHFIQLIGLIIILANGIFNFTGHVFILLVFAGFLPMVYSLFCTKELRKGLFEFITFKRLKQLRDKEDCSKCGEKKGYFSGDECCYGEYEGKESCNKIFCDECKDTQLKHCKDCDISFCIGEHFDNHKCDEDDNTENIVELEEIKALNDRQLLEFIAYNIANDPNSRQIKNAIKHIKEAK